MLVLKKGRETRRAWTFHFAHFKLLYTHRNPKNLFNKIAPANLRIL